MSLEISTTKWREQLLSY